MQRESPWSLLFLIFYFNIIISTFLPLFKCHDLLSFNFIVYLLLQIVPAKCKYQVLSTKIEIRLVKADNIHWTSLEFSKSTSVARVTNVSSGWDLTFFIYLKEKIE